MADRLRSRGRGAIGVGVVALLVTAGASGLVSPTGGADPQRAHDVLCPLDLRADPTAREQATGQVAMRWTPHRWTGSTCGVGDTGARYRSSQFALYRLGEAATVMAGRGPGLDLRIAALVFATLVSTLLGAVAWAAPGPPGVRVGLAALIGMAVAGTGALRSLVWPAGSSMLVVGLLAALAAGLSAFRDRTATAPSLVALAAAGSVVVSVGPGLAVLVPVVVAGLLWQPATPLGDRPSPSPGVGPVRARLLGLALAATVVAVGYATVRAQPASDLYPRSLAEPPSVWLLSIAWAGCLLLSLASIRTATRVSRPGARAAGLATVGLLLAAAALLVAAPPRGGAFAPDQRQEAGRILLVWSSALTAVAVSGARPARSPVRVPADLDRRLARRSQRPARIRRA